MFDNSYIIHWIENNKTSYNAELEKIFNIYYIHLKINKDDLYITKYGFPFIENLKPENFLTDDEWYKQNSVRLSGTSCTYKVRTKKVNRRDLDIVIKWNRMGQDIPGAETSDEFHGAAFNSPFEEFSLVMELRKTKYESPGKIITQKPLAIYVPAERIELWQMGRRQYKIQEKIDKHKDVILDMFRSYIVVYEWVKGIDATQACTKGFISKDKMESLTLTAEEDMRNKGFIVRDRKPHHVIIRHDKSGKLFKSRDKKVLYALVDFELLERTSERETIIKKARRLNYLKRQNERFSTTIVNKEKMQLKQVTLLDVDYVYGRTESTKGALWVVGKDYELFDYFLPERWENTPCTKLSTHHETYHTISKDMIHLVWKLSKTGFLPDVDPYREDERKILEHGYNSPFEEISIAMYISRHGIRTIYPRAIYMTGKKTTISRDVLDQSRFKSHNKLLTPENKPVLRVDRNYLLIWGYWNGPDEKLAALDGNYYSGINALDAYRKKIISMTDYLTILKRKKEKLKKIGIEDLNLGGRHLLLSLDTSGAIIKDNEGFPEVRVCNFEFLKII
ncbi:MAG: hypothetical protein JXB88_10360 [Spirochaetales bacterium]|nr:hypothetical protein [Spirochaetales bacterium]